MNNANTVEIPAPQNEHQAIRDAAEARAHQDRDQAVTNAFNVILADLSSDIAVLRPMFENNRNNGSGN